jgi:putative Mg2+ transporter-C (MgtC) family protein
MNEILGADRFDIVPHLVALGIAYLLALPIGWNREQAERTAGLRTFPLVAIAACGFIQATESLAASSPEAIARIIEGVIVGMGFIGGGAILKQDGSVRGTATAASLWVTGAIGVSVGLGKVDIAVILAVVTFASLFLLPAVKPERRDGEEEDGEPLNRGKSHGSAAANTDPE